MDLAPLYGLDVSEVADQSLGDFIAHQLGDNLVDSITFSTPSIEGTILRRNKVDLLGTHPWKAEATEGDAGLANTVIPAWYTGVYEPKAVGGGGQSGN